MFQMRQQYVVMALPLFPILYLSVKYWDVIEVAELQVPLIAETGTVSFGQIQLQIIGKQFFEVL